MYRNKKERPYKGFYYSVAEGDIIKVRKVFDFTSLYKVVFFWLAEEGFIDPDANDYETLYAEHIRAPGKEIEIKWEIGKVVTSYIKYNIDLYFHGIALKKTEVIMEDGTKLTLDKGQLDIEMSAWLEFDYDAKWRNSPILSKIQYIYNKFIIRKEREKHKKELLKKLYELHAVIKTFLDSYKFERMMQQKRGPMF